jgi:hypothetical protein
MERKQIVLRGGRQDGKVLSVKEDSRTIEVTAIFVAGKHYTQGWPKDGEFPAGIDSATYVTTNEFEDDKEIFEWQS